MREIKFRIWEKPQNKMILFEKTKDIPIGFLFHASRSVYDIMQFTGLKDKNGKEIYEGDIIEVWADKNIHVTNCEIVWKGCGFWFRDISKDEENDGNLYVYSESAYILKIIGNIYENSELLK